MRMPAAIEIRELVKRFGAVRALDGVDMRVRTGEVHGFLGPNGAGKSTTLRILLGLLRHDSGAVQLLGGDPWKDTAALHRRLAYVPGDVALWPELSGGETIDFLLHLRGGGDPRRRAALIEQFALDPRKKTGSYSKGNRQKVALVAALASNAELLIFDEPTSGLDPLMSAVFKSLVAEEKTKGRTVLLSSHVLSEVEALCDRISIVRQGRIIESGSMGELRHLTRTAIEVQLERDGQSLAGLRGLHGFSQNGDRLSFQVEAESMGTIMAELARLGIVSLSAQPPSLEDLFMRHYAQPAEVAR